MAQTLNAKDVVVKVNNVIVGCAQSADFSISTEMDEASCSASGGWRTVTAGRKSWSGSFSALFRELTTAEAATNVSFEDLFDMIEDGAEVDIEYSKTVGGTRYTGKAFLSEVSYSQPDSGNVTWSASYEGNGPFTKILAV